MSIAGPATNTAGKQLNPVAGTVLADTGAVTVPGTGQRYFRGDLIAWMLTGGAAATTVVIEHRNAGNNATIWSQEVNLLAANNITLPVVVKLADQERLRVILGATQPGVGINVQASVVGIIEA